MPRRRSTKDPSKPHDVVPASGRVVALTGAHGYLGRQLIQHFEDDPACAGVLALDVRRPELPLAKTRFYRVDLTSSTADAEIAKILSNGNADTLVHAAFLYTMTPAASWAHELEVIGTLRVLDAVRQCPVRKIIMWSLTSVYGARPDNPNYIEESHEPRGTPDDRAVMDRLAAETEFLRFAKENPHVIVTVLRTAHVLGPTIRNHVTQFFRWPFVPALWGRDPLMQFLHEEDFVDAFKAAIERDAPGVFNIAADGVLPYSTVVAMMGRIPVRLPASLVFPAARALAAFSPALSPSLLQGLRYPCVADTTLARERLGFRPRYDIRAAIADFAGVSRETLDAGGEGGRA